MFERPVVVLYILRNQWDSGGNAHTEEVASRSRSRSHRNPYSLPTFRGIANVHMQ